VEASFFVGRLIVWQKEEEVGVVNTTAKYLARRVDWITSKQLTPADSLSPVRHLASIYVQHYNRPYFFKPYY
jgi:hypothetical protein